MDEERKVQIVRAEWDNAMHIARERREYEIGSHVGSAKRAVNDEEHKAGQPHWHVDRVLELGDVDAYLEHRGTELQELAHSSYAGQYLKLQRVHLAMGGWKNALPASVAVAAQTSTANHAARWQMKYTEDRDELIEWNLCTLRYIESQVHHINDY